MQTELLIVLWYGSIKKTENDSDPDSHVCGLPGVGTGCVGIRSDSHFKLICPVELPFVGLYKILNEMGQLTTFNFESGQYDRIVMQALFVMARSNTRFTGVTAKKLKSFFIRQDFILINQQVLNDIFKLTLEKYPNRNFLEIIHTYNASIKPQATDSIMWFEQESSSTAHIWFFASSSPSRQTHKTDIPEKQFTMD